MKKANIITSLLLIVLSVIVIYLADQFPQVGSEGVTGPDLFPKVLAVLLIVLSFVLLITSTINKYSEKVVLWGKGPARPYMTMGFIVIYFIGLNFLGFYISTPIFLFILIRFLGQKSIVRNIAVSLGVTFIIFWVTHTLLFVPLPTGILLG